MTPTRGPQVLAELKEYATEVDVDFVRKAVRAIGRCAIKVEVSSERRRQCGSTNKVRHEVNACCYVVFLRRASPSIYPETGFLFTPYAVFPTQQYAERCVSTLLDLIQTKVNYVVQEAIVVIRDIFRKYPNKYVRLCEYKGKPVLCIARGNDLNVFTKK